MKEQRVCERSLRMRLSFKWDLGVQYPLCLLFRILACCATFPENTHSLTENRELWCASYCLIIWLCTLITAFHLPSTFLTAVVFKPTFEIFTHSLSHLTSLVSFIHQSLHSSISHPLIWGHRVWVSVTDISQSLYKTHLDALQHCD